MATSGVDAYESIRARVLSGDLPGGSRLVNRTLGKDIGMSHVPVREALHRLVSDGLVEHIPGAGTFVRSLSAEDLSHLYSLRECLECFAVRQACSNISSWQLQVLRKKLEQGESLNEKMRDSGRAVFGEEERAAWFRHEQELHQTILDASGNPWLTKMVEQVHLLARVIQSNPMELTVASVEKILTEHAKLVEAIEDRNGDRASELMSIHIRTGFENQLVRFEGI